MRYFFTMILFLLLTFSACQQAFAHPGNTAADGCHYCRTNCGRWGVPWNERHCHDDHTPVCYPVSAVGNSGQWTFSQNGCNQDITFTWDKGVADDTFSIGISKSAGADPGPKPDTDYRTFTFGDVKPGTWYINVKPGQSCGWGKTVYWKVDVPVVKPTLLVREEIVSEKERLLLVDSKCATSVTSDQSLKNLRPGYTSTTIYPGKDTTYTIYAKAGKEITSQSIRIRYPLPTPTATSTPKIEPTSTPKASNWLFDWIF